MKKILIPILFALIALSCNKSPLEKKKAELTDLKKELTTTKDKISKLEDEIAKIDTSKKEDKSKMVSVTDMTQTTFNHCVEVQARVEGDEDVNVTAEIPGTVTAVLVHTGDHVSIGQVLATLDDRTIHQNLEAMKPQVEMATIMYNKQKNLWDQKIGSEVQFIQAKTQKELMDRQYAALQNQWDMTRIKSPINGTVDEVSIKIGASVAPGVPAIRVVNLSQLKVRGEVAESYIGKIKEGSPVVLFLPDQHKEVLTKLSYSGQVINRLNRTFNVEVKLDAKDGDFHPNQAVVLKIVDYTAPSTFMVPVGALQKSSTGEYVFVATKDNGKWIAKRQTVKSGLTYNGFSEIKEGINTGDKVITFGYQNVIEGDEIKL
jgi:membrane fusion protein, multidrug efflux system